MEKERTTENWKAELIGQAIVRLMIKSYKEKGYTSTAIAQKIGINKSGMSRIKNGQYQLDLDRFLAICYMTEQNPVDLIQRAEALFASTHSPAV
ncbi:helix-turn-helix domain-containing protein [Phaeodactylibacter xiamenensis]|mgnify:CR=1 FL=1|jgi:DNA-binding Xre family transcriptional regulator|uniref:helix-turn-helix domain-containing protein n=1 Tax=Phaeodactylibacter xiamenensis TaxID=1524460 RepID=UPI0024A9DA63|nr:helix-turn-helix transcriptional regulator [Phaeodactylibacter xiamenensis]